MRDRASHLRPTVVTEGRTDICRTVLTSLPAWFGRPTAVDAYVAAAERADMLASLAEDGAPVGILTLKRHTAEAIEIEVLGVIPAWHRCGVGRALVEAAASHAAARGARLMSVKTLAPSHPDPNYAATRRFYNALGFVPVGMFPTLWGEDLPCLLMVRPLAGPSPDAGEAVTFLERALLEADTRTSTAFVSATLDDGFVEFGSSGRVYGKAEIVEALAAERDGPPVERDTTAFKVRPLGDTAVLVTYRASTRSAGRPDRVTLRSSIWERRDGQWRLVFHQGTPAAIA